MQLLRKSRLFIRVVLALSSGFAKEFRPSARRAWSRTDRIISTYGRWPIALLTTSPATGWALRKRLLARFASTASLPGHGSEPEPIPAMEQRKLHVLPTRTIYEFEGVAITLKVKAISALGAHAQLCQTLGKKDEAASYRKVAEQYVQDWRRMAADGDHYRLAFDQPGTWIQKYDLIWDKLLGLNLFPSGVACTEIKFYQTKQNTYGLPLDPRALYIKLDWFPWTATLTDNQADFLSFLAPAYKFTNETPDPLPLTDFYDTDTGKHRAFQARSVVGGIFMKMLAEQAAWKNRFHSTRHQRNLVFCRNSVPGA